MSLGFGSSEHTCDECWASYTVLRCASRVESLVLDGSFGKKLGLEGFCSWPSYNLSVLHLRQIDISCETLRDVIWHHSASLRSFSLSEVFFTELKPPHQAFQGATPPNIKKYVGVDVLIKGVGRAATWTWRANKRRETQDLTNWADSIGWGSYEVRDEPEPVALADLDHYIIQNGGD